MGTCFFIFLTNYSVIRAFQNFSTIPSHEKSLFSSLECAQVFEMQKCFLLGEREAKFGAGKL